MDKSLHQADPEKLKMMLKTQHELYLLSQEYILDFNSPKPQTLHEIMTHIQSKSSQVIGRTLNQVLDTTHLLDAVIAREATRIRQINEERRFALTHASEKYEELHVDKAFYSSIKELSVVLNIMYETGLRECFVRSTERLQDNLNQALAFVR